jgi:hypothetical protein
MRVRLRKEKAQKVRVIKAHAGERILSVAQTKRFDAAGGVRALSSKDPQIREAVVKALSSE